jgi:predicted nuclease with TOPRIM domain
LNLLEKNTNTQNEINFVIDTLNDIKKLNIEDYEEMKKIVSFYSSLVINSVNSDVNLKIDFSKLYNSLNEKTFAEIDNSILELNGIFSKFDFSDESIDKLYKNLGNLNEKLDKLDFTDVEKNYFVLFLNRAIISGFNLNVNF